MLLAALRYIFAAIPAIAFVKRPSVEWKYIVAYGMTVGVGQFSCLFYAIDIECHECFVCYPSVSSLLPLYLLLYC